MSILLQTFWNLLWASFLILIILFAFFLGATMILNTARHPAVTSSNPDLPSSKKALDNFLIRYSKNSILSLFSLPIACLTTLFTLLLRYISDRFEVPRIRPHEKISSALGDMSILLDQNSRQDLLKRPTFWEIIQKITPGVTRILKGITKKGSITLKYFISPLLQQLIPELEPQEISHLGGLLHQTLKNLQDKDLTPQLVMLCKKHFCKEYIEPNDLEVVPFLISQIPSFCEQENISSQILSKLLSKFQADDQAQALSFQVDDQVQAPSSSDYSQTENQAPSPKSNNSDPDPEDEITVSEDRLMDLLETIMLSSSGAFLRTGQNICASFWRNLSSHTPRIIGSTAISTGEACLRTGRNICVPFWSNLSSHTPRIIGSTAISTGEACLRIGRNVCASFWRNLSSHTPRIIGSTAISTGEACLRTGRNICVPFWRNFSSLVSQTAERAVPTPKPSTTSSHLRDPLSSIPGNKRSYLSNLVPDMTVYLERPSFWNKLLQKTHTISHRVSLFDNQIFLTLGDLVLQPSLFPPHINEIFADVIDKKALPRVISTLLEIMSHDAINDSDRQTLSNALALSFTNNENVHRLDHKLASSLLSLWKKISSEAVSASMSPSHQACLNDIKNKYLGGLLKHLHPSFSESNTESITGLINKLNHANSHSESFSKLLTCLMTISPEKITKFQLDDIIPLAIKVAQDNPSLLHDRCLLNVLHKALFPQKTPTSTPDSPPSTEDTPSPSEEFKSPAQRPSVASSVWRAISTLNPFPAAKIQTRPSTP